jgi:hypothetical protein
MPHEADLSAGSEPSFALAQSESAFSSLVYCSESRPYPPAGPETSGGRAIEAAIRIFSKHMTLEENLRPTIDAKAKSLGESGSFYFHDGPNVSRLIDAKPEPCQCFVQTRACEGLAFTDKFHSGTPSK